MAVTSISAHMISNMLREAADRGKTKLVEITQQTYRLMLLRTIEARRC